MQRLETRSWQLMTNITTMQWFCTQQFIVHITWLFLPHNDILCQFRKRRQFTRTASMAITAWLIRPFSSHFCIFLGFQRLQQFQMRLDHNVSSLLQPTRFQYSRILQTCTKKYLQICCQQIKRNIHGLINRNYFQTLHFQYNTCTIKCLANLFTLHYSTNNYSSHNIPQGTGCIILLILNLISTKYNYLHKVFHHIFILQLQDYFLTTDFNVG